MVNFARKSTPAPNEPLKEALDILLKGKSDEYKGKVLAMVRQHKIDADDPIFLLVAGISNMDVALVDAPHQIELILEKYLKSITDQHTKTQLLFDKQAKLISDCSGLVITKIDVATKSIKDNQDKNSDFIENGREVFSEAFERNNTRSEELVRRIKEIDTSIKVERELRVKRPYLNAVNLPAYMFCIIAFALLVVGILLGTTINNQSAKMDEIQKKIEKIDPDRMQIGVSPPISPAKKHKKH